MRHVIAGNLLNSTVNVHLVGVGGNGSQMLTGLGRLHGALKAIGHTGGLDVTVYDSDIVSPANVWRALFSHADVGFYKAIVLTHRVNAFFGLDWTAVPAIYDGCKPCDILITCVDSARARREIGAIIDGMRENRPIYWLDLGNRQQDGQVILGQPRRSVEAKLLNSIDFAQGKRDQAKPMPRLATVLEAFPELLDETIPEDETPSCSLAEALEKQGLYINQHMATWALTLLEILFRRGGLDHHGYFINLESGHVNPILVGSIAESATKPTKPKKTVHRNV